MSTKHFLVLLFFVAVSCNKPDEPVTTQPPITIDPTFVNPLLTSGPDPWVIQKDSFYYYTQTSQGERIMVWRTKAVSKLSSAFNQIIFLRPTTGSNAYNIWAPELHYLDGKWYAYYTAGSSPDHSTQRTFVLENSSPDPLSGAWTDKGKVADAAADLFAIDATIFEHNNKRYMLWSGYASAADNTQRIYIAQMSNPWTLATGRSLISSPQYSWETIGSFTGVAPAVNEAPQILKNANGKVFLIYSASGCWTDDYSLGMMTLKDGGDPLSPADWIKNTSPIFVKRPESNAYGPGHNAFFKSPDRTEDWIIYHANSTTGQGCGDTRNPRMQKFEWNADGTPNFGQPVAVNTRVNRPAGEKD